MANPLADALRRKDCIEWYSYTLLSRLDDTTTGAIVAVVQRHHIDDLAVVNDAGVDLANFKRTNP
jgi:hypothetical protein